jgi:hypothetical protein
MKRGLESDIKPCDCGLGREGRGKLGKDDYAVIIYLTDYRLFAILGA